MCLEYPIGICCMKVSQVVLVGFGKSLGSQMFFKGLIRSVFNVFLYVNILRENIAVRAVGNYLVPNVSVLVFFRFDRKGVFRL